MSKKDAKKVAEKFGGKEKVRIFAARLRNNGTKNERVLWNILRWMQGGRREEGGSYLVVMTDRRYEVQRRNHQKETRIAEVAQLVEH